MSKRKQALLTTAFGASMPDNRNSLTVGPCGPVRVQGSGLIKKPAHHPMLFARTVPYIDTRAASRIK